MKAKSFISCTIAALLASTVIFSGCNNNENNTSSQPAQNSSVSQNETSEKSESSANISTEQNVTSEAKENSDVSEISAEESIVPETPKINPTIWRVTDKDGNYIYMMGTIHAADSSVYDTPDYYEAVYADSDAIAVECDITTQTDDITSSFALLGKMMYSDGTTIKDHVSEDIYNSSVKILKDEGMYSPLYDYYKPVLWTSLMDTISLKYSGLDTKMGVDMTMINRAKSDEKEVIEIESVDFQEDMLINFSDEIQELLLKAYSEDFNAEESGKELKELYENWKNGTLSEELVSDEIPTEADGYTAEEIAAYEEYSKQMITDRNKGMADAAIEYLSGDKTIMFMVGAAHFYGEDGIIKLLESEGCKFEVINDENIVKESSSAESSNTTSKTAESSAVSSETESSSDISIETDPNAARAA